jgi:hypothetical protein
MILSVSKIGHLCSPKTLRQNGVILESLAIIGGLLFYFAGGPGSWSRASLRGG